MAKFRRICVSHPVHTGLRPVPTHITTHNSSIVSFVCIISCCCSHCFRGQSLLFTFRRGQCCCPLSCRPVAGVLQIGYCHRHHDLHNYPYNQLLQLLPRLPRPRILRLRPLPVQQATTTANTTTIRHYYMTTRKREKRN